MAEELDGLIALLKKHKVKRYLEIGSREGDTFHAVLSALPDDAYGLAVDLPGGLWGKLTTKNWLAKAIADIQKHKPEVTYILGDSQSPDVIKRIHKLGPFDAILIDGDHTLAGVSRDWHNYKDLAPIIAFHDIVGTGQREKVSGRLVEVPILWEEIKHDYEHVEFIAEGSAMGIGVILK